MIEIDPSCRDEHDEEIEVIPCRKGPEVEAPEPIRNVLEARFDDKNQGEDVIREFDEFGEAVGRIVVLGGHGEDVEDDYCCDAPLKLLACYQVKDRSSRLSVLFEVLFLLNSTFPNKDLITVSGNN